MFVLLKFIGLFCQKYSKNLSLLTVLKTNTFGKIGTVIATHSAVTWQR